MPIANEFQLPLFTAKPGSENVRFLVEMLAGQDWLNAREILGLMGRADTESNRRGIRALAEASEGKVAGDQRGYKLVKEMTGDEYNHWRNWMTRQAEKMRRRVVEADHIFYGRKKI